MRVTAHDSSLCGGSLFGKSAKMAMTGYTVMAIFDDVLVSSFFVPPRWQGAAALSAAVTTTH